MDRMNISGGLCQEAYALYLEAFPDYPVRQDSFAALWHSDAVTYHVASEGGHLIGFALTSGQSVTLLAVANAYRRRGIGERLLKEAEHTILARGYRRIFIGRGEKYLLQGAPREHGEAIAFLEKRGYRATWESADLVLTPEHLASVPTPQEITLRYAEESDRDALLAVVDAVNHGWHRVFAECREKSFIALQGNEIVGFAAISAEGGRFQREGDGVGSIGCVGVLPREQNRGIGSYLVMGAAQTLFREGSFAIELRYVTRNSFYERLGFVCRHTQWMGEKNWD